MNKLVKINFFILLVCVGGVVKLNSMDPRVGDLGRSSKVMMPCCKKFVDRRNLQRYRQYAEGHKYTYFTRKAAARAILSIKKELSLFGCLRESVFLTEQEDGLFVNIKYEEYYCSCGEKTDIETIRQACGLE